MQQQDEVSNASSVNQPSASEASFIPGQAPQAVADLHMDEPENNLQVMTNGQSSRAQLLQETARELMGVLTRLSGNLGGMGHNQNIVLNFPAFRVQMQGNNIQTVQIRLNEEGNCSRGHNMLIGYIYPLTWIERQWEKLEIKAQVRLVPFCSTKVLQNLNQGLSPMLRPLLLSGLPSSTPMSEN